MNIGDVVYIPFIEDSDSIIIRKALLVEISFQFFLTNCNSIPEPIYEYEFFHRPQNWEKDFRTQPIPLPPLSKSQIIRLPVFTGYHEEDKNLPCRFSIHGRFYEFTDQHFATTFIEKIMYSYDVSSTEDILDLIKKNFIPSKHYALA